MANVRILTAVRNSMLDQIKTAVDAGAGAGTIKFYTGTQATNANTALGAQVLLGTLTFTDPCASSSASGTLTFSTITEDSAADATGTATWARIQDSTGTVVFDCDVTATGGGGTIELNTTSIVTGGPIRISSFTLSIAA